MYGLSLVSASLAENEAPPLDASADFGFAYIRKQPLTLNKDVRLLNKVIQPLAVTGVTGESGMPLQGRESTPLLAGVGSAEDVYGAVEARYDLGLGHQLGDVEHVRATAGTYHGQAEGVHDVA